MTEEERRQSRKPESSGRVPEDFCFATRCTKRALEFIEKNHDDDFLLVVSYEEPHPPWVAPNPFASMYDEVDVGLDEDVFEPLASDKPELHKAWAEVYKKGIPDGFIAQKKRFLACNAYVDYECLDALTNGPPTNTYEALQLVYLFFVFGEHIDRFQVRSLGNLDRTVYPFFRRDLDEGRYTEQELREFFAYFLMQWASIDNYFGHPFYFGGTRKNGESEVNELSFLILDVYDQLDIPTPKLQLKLAANTPVAFIDKALDMIRRGHNSIVFVGEASIESALTGIGMSRDEARTFIKLGEKTGATPDGRLAGEEMSKNLSPTMGMDTNGVTALVKSVTRIDSALLPGDFPLDVMMHPATVRGQEGLDAMRTLIETYIAKGGIAIHFNIFDAEVLRDAQKHPDKYRGLQVRVCGWNVRFNDIAREEQDQYIKRAMSICA